jgi:hypothetical protein
MFEARLMQASLLKKIIEALKDLVTGKTTSVGLTRAEAAPRRMHARVAVLRLWRHRLFSFLLFSALLAAAMALGTGRAADGCPRPLGDPARGC